MSCRLPRLALVGGPFAGFLFGLLAAGPALGQDVVYVDADALPGGDGSSWADAFRDLQAALAVAEGGDEVWIAEGVYRPTAGSDRTATFRLASGVALYGGFDGTEASRNERDWEANETILSGDIGAVGGDGRDNSYHVVTASGVDSTALLDGVTVEEGRANAAAAPDDRGAGLLAVGGSPTVRHARFLQNEMGPYSWGEKLGGGMYVEGGSPLVEDVVFEENTGSGAALYAAGASPVLRRVAFRDNGGSTLAFVDGSAGLVEDALFERNRDQAAFIVASSPVFRRATFRDNVTDAGGTIGAGALIRGGAPRFEDCLFERLRTRDDLYDDGGAVRVEAGDAPTAPAFLRSTFRENTASSGGAVYVQDTHALFVACRFERNLAKGGGALATNLGSVTVLASTFVGNRAGEGSRDGGALRSLYRPFSGARSLVASTAFVGNTAATGGAVSLGGTGQLPADLVNVTFAANEADTGGGAVWLYEAGGVRVRNAVVWGNEAPLGAGVHVGGGAGPTVERAIITGGCPVGATCTGVGSADPPFVRAPDPGPDQTWGSEDDDYGDLRIQAGSPAFDAGLTSLLPADVWDLDRDEDTEEPLPLDAAGEPRVQGEGVDLGAYEGAALPAVAVRVASVGAPLVGAGGSTFEFTVTLANETAEPQALQAWTAVEGPLDRSPVLGPVAVTLPAGAMLTRRLVQAVPAAAPSGTYTYAVAVGTFGGAVVAADSFRVVKQAAAGRAAAGGADAWAVSGWDAAVGPAPLAGTPLAVSVGPNPFRGAAEVALTLAAPSEVSVALYDVLGRRVAVVHEGPLAAGTHGFTLDGSSLVPGLYVVRAEVTDPARGADGSVVARTVTRLR